MEIKRILIIDDESSFRMFLRDVFESRGWSVETVSSGVEGLRRAMSENYSAIITDMVMPGVGGTELIAQLRIKGIGTPIVAITGFSDDEAGLFRAKEYQADCVVYKPFVARDVYEAVDNAIRLRRPEKVPVQDKKTYAP